MNSGKDKRDKLQDAESARRREGALRLFGALSGVDEEYLTACEAKDRGKVRAFTGFGGFVRKYGKAMAAVLCIAVLGISYLGYRTASGTKSFDGNFYRFLPEAGGTDTAQQEPMNGAAYATESYAQEEVQEEGAEKQRQSFSNTEREQEDALADESVSVMQEARKEMTWEQAQQLAVVGDYLPKAWPSQGEITAVAGDDTPGQERVTVSWTYANHWDSFLLTVRNLGDSLPGYVEEALADIGKPEMYDESLYEIPYADTVPAEYCVVFQDPVFAKEDFDRDCVQARMMSHPEDGGDTRTPRGMFGVLYRDGDNYVLVRFNGRGSVDEIWQLLCSVGDR